MIPTPVLCPLILTSIIVLPSILGATTTKLKILQGNDDGWAEANIRALYQLLKNAGHQSIISAPTVNKSGRGSLSKDWTNLTRPGQYDTIPTGAPGVGSDASDDHIWYVNAYPVDGIRYGLGTLAPRLYNGKPDLVISGPNVGKNVDLLNSGSGTVAAANYAAEQGIPSIAVSADDNNRHSYQQLTNSDASYVYASATIRVLNDLLKVGTEGAYLPPDCLLNVNLQKAGAGTQCHGAKDYKFALTTLYGIRHKSGLHHCDSEYLPGERSILEHQEGCWATVTVVRTKLRVDGNAEQKAYVLGRAPEFFSCPMRSTDHLIDTHLEL